MYELSKIETLVPLGVKVYLKKDWLDDNTYLYRVWLKRNRKCVGYDAEQLLKSSDKYRAMKIKEMLNEI